MPDTPVSPVSLIEMLEAQIWHEQAKDTPPCSTYIAGLRKAQEIIRQHEVEQERAKSRPPLMIGDDGIPREIRDNDPMKAMEALIFDTPVLENRGKWIAAFKAIRESTEPVMGIARTLLEQKHSQCDCGIADAVFEALEAACK